MIYTEDLLICTDDLPIFSFNTTAFLWAPTSSGVERKKGQVVRTNIPGSDGGSNQQPSDFKASTITAKPKVRT